MSRPEAGFVRAFTQVRERARVLRPRVRLLGEPSGRTTVGYEVVGGTATAGTDFALQTGTLTFDPGQSVQSVPVQLLDDDEREGRETIKIRLLPAPGAILGTPARLTVAIAAND